MARQDTRRADPTGAVDKPPGQSRLAAARDSLAQAQARLIDTDRDYSRQWIPLAGRQLLADMSGALYWPEARTLVVADLHLEKGSAIAERGAFLPPYDTRTTLGRLVHVIERYDPDSVVALGDSLHDTRAGERLDADDIAMVRGLQEGRDWYWVRGNHDPQIPAVLAGHVVDKVEIAGLALRHAPTNGPKSAEIAGHLHPCARISRHGYSIRRPCFASNGQRLVLPAFGAYTGGLNVLDPAFEAVLGRGGLSVWMIGHEGIYPVAARELIGER
jgi:hypothetical protein